MCGFIEKDLPTSEKVTYAFGGVVMEPYLVLDFEGSELRSL